MKINKPYVFLYEDQNDPANLKLKVLVPSEYQTVGVGHNSADPNYIIELSGANTSLHIEPFEFDVPQDPTGSKILTIKTSTQNDADLGIVKIDTANVSRYWPYNFIPCFHLEGNVDNDTDKYRIHVLVSDFLGTFNMVFGTITHDEVPVLSNIEDSYLNGNYQYMFWQYNYHDANQTGKLKILIYISNGIGEDGKVILAHADADIKFLPNWATSA